MRFENKYVFVLTSSSAIFCQYACEKKKVAQNECWIVLKGVLYVSLFDIDKSKIKNLILKRGSILITVGGGHSINKSSKNTEIVEIKLGPYNGKDTIYY